MSIYKGTQLISGVATPIEPTRNIGQLIQSLLPLTDAGLHLLDGSVIDGNGIYKSFVDYISKLDLSASYFVTETEWQTSVDTYGVCGKFVYNSTNHTVRLPKVTGHIEGTLDANALGDLIEAGLPNITGSYKGHSYHGEVTGAIGVIAGIGDNNGNDGDYNANTGLTFDASRCSSVYKNDVNTVQTQSILGYMYIVVATTTKTDIEVDIDNIATDLNNKVDVSNMVNAGSYISGCAMPSDKYIDLTLGASGLTYTAPANGFFCFYRMPNSPAGYSSLVITNTGFITEARNTVNGAGNGIWTPARKNDVIQLNYDGAGTVTCWRFYYAEGEVE